MEELRLEIEWIWLKEVNYDGEKVEARRQEKRVTTVKLGLGGGIRRWMWEDLSQGIEVVGARKASSSLVPHLLLGEAVGARQLINTINDNDTGSKRDGGEERFTHTMEVCQLISVWHVTFCSWSNKKTCLDSVGEKDWCPNLYGENDLREWERGHFYLPLYTNTFGTWKEWQWYQRKSILEWHELSLENIISNKGLPNTDIIISSSVLPSVNIHISYNQQVMYEAKTHAGAVDPCLASQRCIASWSTWCRSWGRYFQRSGRTPSGPPVN